MRSAKGSIKWATARRRALGLLATSALATGSLAAAGVAASGQAASAATSSTSTIVYQVHPIAVQATQSTSATSLSPAACIASYGLACYGPQILHTAYQVPWTINGQLAGTGEQIAIVDAFGSPTVASDLATFDAAFGLPAPDLHIYYPDGQPTYNPLSGNETGWAEETSLDVQTAHDLAPGARINLIVASSNNGNDLNNAEQYAVTNHLGNVMSMSFGAAEAAIAGGGNNLQLQQANSIYTQAAAAGISVFASSGDSGATNGYSTANALFPASDPNVTATGGTDLFVKADTAKGNSTNGTYASETAWNDSYPATCPFGCDYGVFGATGGAPSAVFPAASYQSAVSGMSMRTTSDVSFNASVYTATMIYLGFLGGSNNGFYFFGGTSEASPSWAAITADLDQAAGTSLGLLNPTLYSLAGNPTTYAADFHDVTVGNNQDPYPSAPGFPANTGYDLPTGLGTPIVSGLIHSLAPGASAGYTQP
ncbi:MAG: S53 family peptidase [Acidimicrobiales bacterium]